MYLGGIATYTNWIESDLFYITDTPYLDIDQPTSGLYYTGQAVNVEVNSNLNYSLTLVHQSSGHTIPITLNQDGDMVLFEHIQVGEYALHADQLGGGDESDVSGVIQIATPVDGAYSLNFVRTKVARVPAKTEANFDALATSSGQSTETMSYADGLGRARQSISLHSTPSGNHMVTPFVYDEIGQTTTTYVPYPSSVGTYDFKVASIESQASFYDNPSSGIASTTAPFAKIVTDKSPMLTIKEQGSVGEMYQPGAATTKIDYRMNADSDNIQSRDGEIDATGTPDSTNYYSEGEMSITQTTDEDDNVSEVYVDREGREILKIGYLGANKTNPVQTYIYDDFEIYDLSCPLKQ